MSEEDKDEKRFIRLPEVKRLTGLSESSIRRLEQDGEFPSRRRVGKAAVAWPFSEIRSWMDTREKVNLGKEDKTHKIRIEEEESKS